jgi:hypothetical protein
MSKWVFDGLTHQISFVDSTGNTTTIPPPPARQLSAIERGVLREILMDKRKSNAPLMRAVGVVAAIALAWMPVAYGKTCTEQEVIAADEAIDHLDTWSKVNEMSSQYAHCDEGEIAEGNSEAVARLLVNHWRTLPQLGVLIRHDPSLKDFVLRHINTTLDTDDLSRIATLSRSSCPTGMRSLCRELANTTEKALP